MNRTKMIRNIRVGIAAITLGGGAYLGYKAGQWFLAESTEIRTEDLLQAYIGFPILGILAAGFVLFMLWSPKYK